MANTKSEKLFTEFPPVPTEKWEEVITADLKGADYERKLVWKTGEGFNVRPYYRAENLEGIKFLGSQAGEFPYVRGTHAHNRWRVHQTVSVVCPKEANAEALKILNAGVDSLGFCIASADFSAADLDMLLKDICIPAVEITFCGEKMANVAELVLAKVEKEGIAKEDVRIAFCIDPLVKGLSSKGDFCSPNGEKCIARIVELIHKTKEYKHVRIVTVAGQTFGNSGSTIVEELAFTLSAGHDYLVRLTDAGLDVDQAARKLRFSFSVSSNYFMEIAKFRAARMLWANIVKGYGPAKNCACKMHIHAETSRWNQTVYDPYVNMLRGTTEAMSATIAGVHSLEVTPFDTSFENPTEFSKRIARNVELLLKNESHFDQVVDPAGGSYYVENLTQSIAAEAWKLFLEIEQKGGYTEAYKAGLIVERIKASAAAKDKNIATRRQTLLGANQYPNFTEVAGKEITDESVTRKQAEGNVLVPYRGAMAFEEMRLQVDRSGKEPKAFMLTCGNLGMARARSQFSCNFFACAGIKVIDNTYFKSIEEGAKAALESKAQIVVVCASDDDYAEAAPKVKELLGGKAILVVAGAPACAPELEAQGITNFINVKSNVLETLKFYLKEMGI
ncbi:acyl-CoA mutase large subunit family protein [Alistipes onderdonkii]|uniref:methylmalonyl-CoA mutase family protein n=1 Tax=Alistipes onderdonkii TaxID=328813 RepID=UPI001C37BF9F|nr:methylmalonyl-CoA mutase family protein [Alistipes onderdonkii]MBV4288017.1 acyl-CoA mutase large subunit family protein [Alistipes onderdonkii]MBV4302104.1 acyl-CoA mutase large subunit family protein [Alistipes onderdonkii]MBV4313680.1 acyl-CoA mutase large subunit family protein [Alistipes onderdonkii]MBV4347101.1 acyl-CoA mutase large subunit family protein [Alistipes onderdonkii]